MGGKVQKAGEEMIPIVQSRTGDRGTCFRACMASIFELPESSVPDFGADDDNEFFSDIDAWLASKGFSYQQVPVGGTPPVGYHTIEGTSPRGGQHAIVGYNGKPVHDPHPQDGTGRGLVDQKVYGVLSPAKKRHLEKLHDRKERRA